MSEEMVRVLKDSKNDVYETVPISKVPPGYIRVHIRDHGECYMDPATLSAPPGYRHPPFSPEVCEELQKQHETLVRAGWEKDLDQWLDGFRYDNTTWREMAHWEFVVAALNKFTSHLPGDDELSASKRGDVFAVLTTVGDDLKRAESHLQRGGGFEAVHSLTGKRVTEIVTWLLSDEAKEVRKQAREKYRDLLRERIAEVYPNRIGLHALFDESGNPNADAPHDPVEFIATADIIMGEDVTTPSKRFVVHGKERYEQLVANAVDGEVDLAGVRLVWVEIDVDTDEYDRLIGVVHAIKGRDDYQMALPDDDEE